MSRSADKEALLDEKIARIRANNEQIIKRKEMIQKEIELAIKHNAMVDVKATKLSEDDLNPTLYSDTIENHPQQVPKKLDREQPKRERIKSNNNHFPVKSKLKDDSVWRAERNQIDRERIRRQKANNGWRREWDADKSTSDNEFSNSTKNSSYSSDHSRERRTFRPSQTLSVREKRSESPALNSILTRGRGRPLIVNRSTLDNQTNKNCNSGVQNTIINQNSPQNVEIHVRDLKRTIKNDHVAKEKASLVKKVSWKGENELIDDPSFRLKDGNSLNLKVRVNNGNVTDEKRAVQILDKRKPLIKSENLPKFDEKTSWKIKDCVLKTVVTTTKERENFIEGTVRDTKSISGSVKTDNKDRILNESVKNTSATPTTDSQSNFNANDNDIIIDAEDFENDDEWEDASDEEWEDVSDEG